MPRFNPQSATDRNRLAELAIRHVLDTEGGYVDNPYDRGGKTKYGISQRQYPDLNILTLTLEDAIAIYQRDYWLAYDCHQLPPAFGVFLFDAVVNHNPKTAVRFIQRALRITTDGIIGPHTLGAARRAAVMSSFDEVLSMAFAYRADYYHDLMVANRTQERFALGWFKRLFNLQKFIVEEVQR